jgi:hypothetical protein
MPKLNIFPPEVAWHLAFWQHSNLFPPEVAIFTWFSDVLRIIDSLHSSSAAIQFLTLSLSLKEAGPNHQN